MSDERPKKKQDYISSHVVDSFGLYAGPVPDYAHARDSVLRKSKSGKISTKSKRSSKPSQKFSSKGKVVFRLRST